MTATHLRLTEPDDTTPPARATTRSGLYVGTVNHARTTPTSHRFSRRAAYFVVDLDELPMLARRLRLLVGQ